jgi:hypothetical protein
VRVSAVRSVELPAWSLLARHRGAECYRDAFAVEVAGAVSLAGFVARFYGSRAFWPERMALHLIGRGANRADIAALAEGRSDTFAAWSVEAREDARTDSAASAPHREQILLRDFQDRTCSWLAVEEGVAPALSQHSGSAEGPAATRLWFGTGLRPPEAFVARTLVPVHRWYARRLLAGVYFVLTESRMALSKC